MSVDLQGLLVAYVAGAMGYTATQYYLDPPISTPSSVSGILTYLPAINTLWKAGSGIVTAGAETVDFVGALLAGVPGGAGVVAYYVASRATGSQAMALLGSAAAGGLYGYVANSADSADSS